MARAQHTKAFPLGWPLLEDVTEAYEVYVDAVDDDAFGFKALCLFDTICATQQNLAAFGIYFTDDAMPRQRWVCSLERPGGLAGASGKAGREGDLTVGGYFALGNFLDVAAKLLKHYWVRMISIW